MNQTQEKRSFTFPDLDNRLQRGIRDLGFETPTPIQQQAIPHGLDGRDVLGCAVTGSGKTAAFLLPILERILDQPRGTTRALVLSPTRELAAQTVDHFRELARHTKLRAAAVFGGIGMRPQIQAFRQGVDLIAACPGRLLDHMQYPYARISGLEVLVLDEADRMLDMGFLPDIKRILSQLPKAEQRLLFSATMPPAIAELADGLLISPVKIGIERVAAPAAKIEQAIFEVQQSLKPSLLLALLEREAMKSVLVFTRTKHRADRLATALERQGVAAERIHGNRSQGQRTKALHAFKNGRVKVLVATDIAARGIDVDSLSHVINFDVPNLSEDYIHRVGRTARASASGVALTFASPQERGDLRTIERAVGQLPRRQLDGFDLHGEPAAGVWSPQSGGGQQQGPSARSNGNQGHAKPRQRRPAQRPEQRQSDARRGDSRRPDSQHSDARNSGNRRPGVRHAARQRDGARRDETSRSDTWRGDSRRGEARPADSRRQGDNRHNDTRRSDTRQGDTRRRDTQRSDTRQGDTRRGARPGDARQGDTRHADARPSNPRGRRRPNRSAQGNQQQTADGQRRQGGRSQGQQSENAQRGGRPPQRKQADAQGSRPEGRPAKGKADSRPAQSDTGGGKKPRRRRGNGGGQAKTTAFAQFERTGPTRAQRRKAHRVAYP